MQGREKDIVIFSAVRSRRSGGPRARIGFVADERRLNVGLTRARTSLLVVGNFAALRSDANWRALVQHARDSGYARARAATPAPFCIPAAASLHRLLQQELPSSPLLPRRRTQPTLVTVVDCSGNLL